MLASMVSLCAKIPIAGKAVFSVFLAVSTLCFVVDLACFVIFDTPLSSAMIFTALETTTSESFAFASLYRGEIAEALGIFAFLLFVFFLSLRKISVKILTFFALLGLPIFAYQIYLFSHEEDCRFNSVLSFVLPFRYGCEFYGAFQEIANAKKTFFDNSIASVNVSAPPPIALEAIKNIVLIIGESTQRDVMQIYDSSRSTTPILAEMQKKGEILVFSDVISPHAQTTLSLRKVLTFSNFENQSTPWYQQDNLVSLFKRSGYPVYWISNQLDIESMYSSSTRIIASLSDVSIFVSRFKRHFDEVFYDEKILPELDEIRKAHQQEKGVFILHLMGAHSSYGNRYPSEFAKFSDLSIDVPTRLRARYLNAVFYNDYIVSEIFKRFSHEDSIVIYLSDHGEEVYDFRDFVGHADDKISRFMVEIPMIIYLSDLFKQKHPKIYQQIQSALTRPYMIDDVIHMVLDIAGIRTDGFDPRRSVINDAFNSSRKRIVGGKDYDLELKGEESKH